MTDHYVKNLYQINFGIILERNVCFVEKHLN